MQTSPAVVKALRSASLELEAPLLALEERLTALGLALRERDPDRIEAEAAGLHRALAGAIGSFSRAARQGPLPGPLRARLMSAGAQVAAQREVLARATASLDRAMDVLLPPPAPGVYSSLGGADKPTNSGSAQA